MTGLTDRLAAIAATRVGIEEFGHVVCAGSRDLQLVRRPPTIAEASASALVHAAVRLSRADGGGRIAVAVTDATGELVAFLRDDGAPLRAINIAIMKAHTAARLEKPTLAFQQSLTDSGHTISDYGDPMVTALAGGVPLVVGGCAVGGLGVSGRLPAEDHELAMAVVSGLDEIIACEPDGRVP